MTARAATPAASARAASTSASSTASDRLLPCKNGRRERPFFMVRTVAGIRSARLGLATCRNRRAAAAGRGRVRVLDHELGALDVLLVVDLGAHQILVAHRIDQQGDAVPLHSPL